MTNPTVSTMIAVANNSYPTSVSCVNNLVYVDASIVATIARDIAVKVNDNPVQPLWYTIIPQPAALFVGLDANALRPNQWTSSITTDLQAPAWIASTLIPQPSLFAGSDVYSLLANQNMNASVTKVQIPEILQLPAQPALSITADIKALYPNTTWTQFITALQPPSWNPSNINQPALFAFSPHDVVFPNITWNVPNLFLQAPEWLPTVFIPQPALFAGMDMSALLANQLSLQALLDNANLTIEVVEEKQLVQSWWRKWQLNYFFNLIENLGAVTESVVVNKISATINFIFNKLQTFVDIW